MPPEADSDRLNRAVEQLFALARDSANKQSDFIKEWAVKHGELSVHVTRIETQLAEAAKVACPKPGMCIIIASRLTEQEKDISALKTAHAELQGGWRSLLGVAGAIGGAAGIAAAIAAWVRKP